MQTTTQDSKRQTKRIIVCCDGTWKTGECTDITNVKIFHDLILDTDPKTDIKQIKIHIDGVGTGGKNPIHRGWSKIWGGVTGQGLSENVQKGYTHIAKHYLPGDEICVVGFSRGAYTARSLVGFLRQVGILDKNDPQTVSKAYEIYRNRTPEHHPNTERSKRFRAENASQTVLDQNENDWREENGFPTGQKLMIQYLGVWDTVGSLGTPGGIFGLVNRRFRFHDTQLSSIVNSARHAVAIEEHRKLFSETPWTNLVELQKARENPNFRKNTLQATTRS